MKKKGFVCNSAKKDPTAATDNMKQLQYQPLTKLEFVRFWGFLYSATLFSVEGTRLSFSNWCPTNWLLFFNLVCFVYNRIHQAQNIHTKKNCVAGENKHGNHYFKVPPRLELGSLDSESRVLTITPSDLWQTLQVFIYTHLRPGSDAELFMSRT